MRKTDRLVDKLIAELKRTGIPMTACNKVGLPRATYYRWRQEDTAFKIRTDDAIQIGRENVTDLAESRLVKNISDGNQRAIEYQLGHNDSRYKSIKRVEFDETRQIQEERPSGWVIRKLVDILFDAIKIDETEDAIIYFGAQEWDKIVLETKELSAVEILKGLIRTEVERRIEIVDNTNNSEEDTVQ